MRIGIEAQRIFRKKKHGMDMVALELIRAIQRLNTSHEFVVFVKPDEDEACLTGSANVEIVKVPASAYPIWEQINLPKAAAKAGVDLLHCTSNTAPVFMKMPLVLTLHDIIYLEKLNFSQGTTYQKMGNLYRRINVPAIVPKARKIFTVSEFERCRILSHFNLPDDRVITAYNGVGAHFHKITDVAKLREAKEKFKLPDQFIFFLGNTDPKKNVTGVLKALSILKKSGQMPCKLVMLDINRDYLKQQCEAIGDSSVLDDIMFTGYVPNTDLPSIYSQASLFLYPSLRESFGIPLVEAMKCEVPLITSNTSSMPEIAGDSALLVDPFKPGEIAEAVTRLWNDQSLQRQLVDKGKERASRFSWDENARLTLNVYENLFM